MNKKRWIVILLGLLTTCGILAGVFLLTPNKPAHAVVFSLPTQKVQADGYIDFVDDNSASGWYCAKNGSDTGLFAKADVNGKSLGIVERTVDRPDVPANGLCQGKTLVGFTIPFQCSRSNFPDVNGELKIYVGIFGGHFPGYDYELPRSNPNIPTSVNHQCS